MSKYSDTKTTENTASTNSFESKCKQTKLSRRKKFRRKIEKMLSENGFYRKRWKMSNIRWRVVFRRKVDFGNCFI